jgi:LuxR family quorum sensing-dependent transcriptional regulator
MQVAINSVTNVLSVIKRINSTTTIDGIFEELSCFAQGYGFDTTSILPLLNPALGKINIWDVGRSNWPEEFQKRWVDKQYIFHDPISRFAMKSRSAFEWKTAYNHASRFGQKILDEARDFALYDGLAVPVMYQNYPTGMISLGFEQLELSPDEIAEIELVCIHSYCQLLKVSDIECNISCETLTPREIDVLYYAAAGKTNWEISSIYNISEYSVKDHMKNISRKLDASNRAHAVTLGILSGQIIP